MSYVANVMRRRQELERAFRERYNPADEAMRALSELDKEMQEKERESYKRKTAEEQAAYEREKDARAEKAREDEAKRRRWLEDDRRAREIEAYYVEKGKADFERKAKEDELADRRVDREALAKEREARAKEWEAREAAKRQESQFSEEDRAKGAVAEQAYGLMQRKGLTTADVYGAPAMEPGLRDVAKSRGADTTAIRVGDMSESLDELAGAGGMSVEELLSRVEGIESERMTEQEKLRLLAERTEAEKRRFAPRARGAGGGGAAAPAKSDGDEGRKARMASYAERKAAADAARAEEKLARDRMAAGSNGRFQLTESQRSDLQKRRTAVLDRATAAKGIRSLLAKYPDLDKYTGPIDQYVSGVRAKLGDKAAAEILSALGRASDEYRTAVTGAAASDEERKMLDKRVPNPSDSVAAILGKLSVDDEYFRNKFAIIDAQINANDIRGADALLGIESVAPMAPAAPAAAAASPAATMMSDEEEASYEE